MDKASPAFGVDKNTKAILDAVSTYLADKHDRSATVIDLGCGRGWLLHELRKKGFANLTGVGYRVLALEGARIVPDIDLCNPGWADRCGLGQYSVAVATEVIEHLTNPFLFLRETHRLLRHSGELVLTFPNVHNLRSIVGYAIRGRFSGFFGSNFNDGHPLFDQHIFIPNMHLIDYFLQIAGFALDKVLYINGSGRLFSQTTFITAKVSQIASDVR